MPGLVIGRGTEADLRINDPGVSRRHARISPENGGAVVEDLGIRFVGGDRHIAAGLVEQGYDVTGIDGSEGMLTFARMNAPGAEENYKLVLNVLRWLSGALEISGSNSEAALGTF